MKKFIGGLMTLLSVVLLCGMAFVVGYVVLIAISIPQMPTWAQPGMEEWLLDIPQYAETSDNGSYGTSTPAGMSAVPWD